MLESLKVKNFAIIEDIQINFKNGMTVLTGETGAGKSLIIDTISLLLGQRADNDMIRYGETKASIEGIFSYQNAAIDETLDRFGILKQDKLNIVREIMANGRNNIRLNGTVISLAMLKQIAVLLADVHVQNDTYRLFMPENYLSMITPIQDDKYDDLKTKYTVSLSKYLNVYRNYEHIVKGQKESIARLEFLEYEKQELSNLNLEKGIDEKLKNEISKLENFDKIFTNLTNAYTFLEGDYPTLDNLYESANSLKRIIELDVKYQENYDKVLDSYYILEEIKSNIA
ncbi:MAG: AAA family ATPase [Anaeroplasmataceae bacterium]|nr:AAA family ATPase [Anaeroplasmataceae bacterium]